MVVLVEVPGLVLAPNGEVRRKPLPRLCLFDRAPRIRHRQCLVAPLANEFLRLCFHAALASKFGGEAMVLPIFIVCRAAEPLAQTGRLTIFDWSRDSSSARPGGRVGCEVFQRQ